MTMLRLVLYNTVRVIGCVSLFSLLGTSCPKVKVPPSDATPPVIYWGLSDRQVTESNQTIQVKEGEEVALGFNAEDKESGISYISSGGGGEYTCSSGSIGQKTSFLGATEENTFQPDKDGNLNQTAFRLIAVELGKVKCPPGYTFSQGSITYTGKARNGLKAETVSNITFNR